MASSRKILVVQLFGIMMIFLTHSPHIWLDIMREREKESNASVHSLLHYKDIHD